MWKHVLTLLLGMAIWFGMTDIAQAGGCLLNPEQLPAELRTQLEEDVAAAKAQNPEPFKRIRQQYSQAFNPTELISITGETTIGFGIAYPMQEELLPLIEILVFNEPELPRPATDRMIYGVFYAIQRIDDDRARAIMKVIIDVDIPGLVSGAIKTFAQKGDDSSVATILQYLTQFSGEKKVAVIKGMMFCDRLSCLQALVPEINAQPDADTAKQLAESIGFIAMISYWNSPVMASRNPYIDEGPQVRTLAAQTLIAVYPKYTDATVREAIFEALKRVLHKRTQEFIDLAAKGKPPETADALNELKMKYIRALNSDRQVLRDKKYWDYAE